MELVIRRVFRHKRKKEITEKEIKAAEEETLRRVNRIWRCKCHAATGEETPEATLLVNTPPFPIILLCHILLTHLLTM